MSGDLEIPGRGQRRIVAQEGQAMQINRTRGTRIRIDEVEVIFPGDEPLMLMPLDLWARTLTRAIEVEQVKIEARSRQDRRRMARQLRQDARN